ncbi:hypothetical protein [Sedimentibacter sp. MB31-C6]|uniref:hypothetical protein n=1 Tax=Sedimentibacter sp. MB31-C6 TaxID=3109366 RepID=UPI002DDD8463|nr:hypothetical protein [Sedimentibacter sp. MB36-C1]WSI03345.1 hypothetical protein U8307_09830 [Sedimentibacter sp. MB36-C1]
MPPISTHMHFGKIFIENTDDDIDIPSFIMGIVYPDTINDEDFEEVHSLDEDGNIDVREFYEQFDFKRLNLIQKSFVLGYYCHIWFEEYYKFNASKLIVHNNLELNDEELSAGVKNILRYYDDKAIGSYYDKIKIQIKEYNTNLNLKELDSDSIKLTKDKILKYFKETSPKNVYLQLIEEDEYVKFIFNSYRKIIKSL